MDNLFGYAYQEQKKENKRRVLLDNIEITNYRAIDYLNIKLRELGVILKGLNGVGKTSVIEAVYFLFSGKLFDGRAKLGDQNITPTHAEKGTKTTIKATFTNGFTFAITLWEEWNDTNTIVRERKSVYEVNGGVVKTVRGAYDTLYQELGIADLINDFKKEPTLKAVDLVRLFYDLRYLREIDYKELRALVIDIVGDIEYTDLIQENTTKYARLVEPLKASNLDLEATKQKLRGEKFGTPSSPSGLEKIILSQQALIDTTQKEISVSVDKIELENAKTKIKELDTKIIDLKASKHKDSDSLTKDIDLKISKLENELLKERQLIQEQHDKKVATIKEQNAKLDEPLKLYKETINNLKQERLEISTKINDEEIALNKISEKINAKKRELEYNQAKRQELVDKYKKAQNPTSEKITAPVSKEQFFLHEALEYVKIRDRELAEITKNGVEIKNLIDENQEAIETLTLEYENQETKTLKTQEQRIEIDKKISENENLLEQEQTNLSKSVLELPTIDFNSEKVLNLMEQIKALKNERNALIENGGVDTTKIDSEIAELENEKVAYQEILNSEVIQKDRERALERHIERLKELKKRLIEVDELLTLIKELEKDKYTKIDLLVKDKFGENIKFKLFDYNITDESINTRVCDLLVVDGNGKWVNIKDINTGNYPLVALDFITRVKEHYGIKKSFTFIDEYGVIDKNNRAKVLAFGEQIIATEPSDSPKIEIVNI